MVLVQNNCNLCKQNSPSQNRHTFNFGYSSTFYCEYLFAYTWVRSVPALVMLWQSPQSCVICCCPLCDWTVNVSGSSGWLAFTVATVGNCTSFLNVCLSGLGIDFLSVCLYYSGSPPVDNPTTHAHTNVLTLPFPWQPSDPYWLSVLV